MNETKPVRCLVAVYNSGGEPDMFRTVVDVTASQRRSGVHYERARAAAEEAGYDPSWVADEDDPGFKEYRRTLDTVNVDELVVLLEGARNIVSMASSLLQRYAGFECLKALGLIPKDLHAQPVGVDHRTGAQINFGAAYASMSMDSTPEQQLRARAAIFGERSASAEILRELERLRGQEMNIVVEVGESGTLKLTQNNG